MPLPRHPRSRLPTVVAVALSAAVPALLLSACEGLFPEVGADAGGSGAAAALSTLDAAGRQAFEAYGAAPPNKAFALSEDAAWAWHGGAPSLTSAQSSALERCEAVAAAPPCHIVAWDVGTGWTAEGDTGAANTAGSATGHDTGNDTMPALDDPGVAAFQTFLAADGNKAFAVSPDGAWGWRASSTLPLEAVQQEAQASCARHAEGCEVVVTAPDLQGLASLPR